MEEAEPEEAILENAEDVAYEQQLSSFRCRITGDVMKEPLLASDGMQKIYAITLEYFNEFLWYL